MIRWVIVMLCAIYNQNASRSVGSIWKDARHDCNNHLRMNCCRFQIWHNALKSRSWNCDSFDCLCCTASQSVLNFYRACKRTLVQISKWTVIKQEKIEFISLNCNLDKNERTIYAQQMKMSSKFSIGFFHQLLLFFFLHNIRSYYEPQVKNANIHLLECNCCATKKKTVDGNNVRALTKKKPTTTT